MSYSLKHSRISAIGTSGFKYINKISSIYTDIIDLCLTPAEGPGDGGMHVVTQNLCGKLPFFEVRYTQLSVCHKKWVHGHTNDHPNVLIMT